MQQSAKEYIHATSAGHLESCREIAGLAKQQLSNSYAKKDIEGWETIIIHQQADLDNYYILTNPCKAAGDKFPFLFLAIQFILEEDKSITDWVENNGFIEVFE